MGENEIGSLSALFSGLFQEFAEEGFLPRKTPKRSHEMRWDNDYDELIPAKKAKTVETSKEEEQKRAQPAEKQRKLKKSRDFKSSWTQEESDKLVQLVQRRGPKSWNEIAKSLGTGKTGPQCSQRWTRVANPAINRSPWLFRTRAKFKSRCLLSLLR